MHLTPKEIDKLQLLTLGMIAERRLKSGLKLNHPEAVAYIRSEDNYVNIFYLDQGLVKKFMLRSSMRALEDLLSKHGLVRCHRSYFVNPAFIKIVHRDAAGLIVADLKLEGQESIPISRKYQDAITRLL